MTQEKARLPEETLDPEDWEAMRALGHRMLDDMLDYLQTVRQRPVWQHAPEPVKAHFRTPLPLGPEPPEAIYAEFRENILPYPVGNIHPRFWGWVFGTGTVLGALADLLAAAMNTNSGDLAHHSALHVEKQVIAWCKEMLGFPDSASGLLMSGCSAANLIGLAVARNARAGFEVRRAGLPAAPQRMTLYTSQETHSSIQKAVELLGLGSEALRYVPVNDDFQVDLQALRVAIAQDRAEGRLPFCVVGSAGTANTGAIDDLDALADICRQEKLWFHIDGAFGAWAKLAPAVKDRVSGLERADSLAFDLHKWMYLPYEIACILVRDEAAHRQAFALTPVYLARENEGCGLTGGDLPWLTDYGFELSRGFRALKAWMSLKEHGSRKFGRLIQQNIVQAQYLAQLIETSPELELAAPVALNVVCFRYLKAGLNDAALDALNKAILVELQEQGIAVLSGTTIRGKYVLRVGHTNHRSRREDFDVLVSEIIRIGREIGCSEV
jgi:glutamate/tyrosine decarboxylase-like PLP-dependent enzyme